ncbi:MAG: hypothetical protein H7833_02825 [Magnetococcus sp. DMHC-1]|nr:hypothetical protein [Magnetococcales bacterium]
MTSFSFPANRRLSIAEKIPKVIQKNIMVKTILDSADCVAVKPVSQTKRNTTSDKPIVHQTGGKDCNLDRLDGTTSGKNAPAR